MCILCDQSALHCVYDDLLTVKLTEDFISFSKLQVPSRFSVYLCFWHLLPALCFYVQYNILMLAFFFMLIPYCNFPRQPS